MPFLTAVRLETLSKRGGVQSRQEWGGRVYLKSLQQILAIVANQRPVTKCCTSFSVVDITRDCAACEQHCVFRIFLMLSTQGPLITFLLGFLMYSSGTTHDGAFCWLGSSCLLWKYLTQCSCNELNSGVVTLNLLKTVMEATKVTVDPVAWLLSAFYGVQLCLYEARGATEGVLFCIWGLSASQVSAI